MLLKLQTGWEKTGCGSVNFAVLQWYTHKSLLCLATKLQVLTFVWQNGDIFAIYLATVARISLRNLEGGKTPAFLTHKMWCGLNLPTII